MLLWYFTILMSTFGLYLFTHTNTHIQREKHTLVSTAHILFKSKTAITEVLLPFANSHCVYYTTNTHHHHHLVDPTISTQIIIKNNNILESCGHLCVLLESLGLCCFMWRMSVDFCLIPQTPQPPALTASNINTAIKRYTERERESLSMLVAAAVTVCVFGWSSLIT